MSGSVDSVDQALQNVFSFEIAIISASGKNVEFSCWVIDKFCVCCEISYGVNLLSHFRPSSLPLSTYQPVFHNFLCSLFAFAHSLSKVRALSASVWSMAFCRAQEGWSPQGKKRSCTPGCWPWWLWKTRTGPFIYLLDLIPLPSIWVSSLSHTRSQHEVVSVPGWKN